MMARSCRFAFAGFGLALVLVPAGTVAAGDCCPRQVALLPSPSGGQEDFFGVAVVVHGDVLLVGAPLDDLAGEDAGAVHEFRRVAGAWVHEGPLIPADVDPGQQFGRSLARDRLDPDLLVIGSPGDDDVAPDRGSAYLFRRQPDGAWLEVDKIIGDNTPAGSYFGMAVAVEGGTVVVGAPLEDNIFGGAVGNAYVFEAERADDWTQTDKLFVDNVPDGGGLGMAVVVRGDLIAVGAPYLGGEFLPGSVSAFRRDGAVWELEQQFESLIPLGRDRFGISIVLTATGALVGSPRDGVPPTGLVVSVERGGDGHRVDVWEPVLMTFPDDTTLVDRFGGALAAQGDTVLIGATNHDDHGDVYEYELVDGVPEFRCLLSASNAAPWDLFGNSVSLDGPLAAVGAVGRDGPAPDSGAVYVFSLAGPDVTGDGTVDVDDLVALILAWGSADPGADVNADGTVDVDDLVLVILEWGPCR